MKKNVRSCYAFGVVFYQSITLHLSVQLNLDYSLWKSTDKEKKSVDRKGNMYGANGHLNKDAIETGMPYKTFLTTRTFAC